MKVVDARPDGSKWLEIESDQEAIEAGNRGRTAFGHYFIRDRQRGSTARYLVLEDTTGAQTVYCRIPPREGTPPPPFNSGEEYLRVIVVAPHNGNPFPTHKDEIQALSLVWS
jgi:hypothetical protein